MSLGKSRSLVARSVTKKLLDQKNVTG